MRKRNIFKVFELEDIRYSPDEEKGCGGNGVMIEDVSICPLESRRPMVLFDFRQDKAQVIDYFKVRPAFHISKSFLIYGIVGAIQLISTRFLLVITGSNSIGDITGNTIYKVSKIQMLKISGTESYGSSRGLGCDLDAANQRFISSIEALIQRHDFYYSDSFDLTSFTQLSFTRENALVNGHKRDPHIRNANKNFTWNFYLAEQLMEEGVNKNQTTLFSSQFHPTYSRLFFIKLDAWITPMIDGCK